MTLSCSIVLLVFVFYAAASIARAGAAALTKAQLTPHVRAATITYSDVQQLSNETTVTSVATANWMAAIHTQPIDSSPVIAHLRYFTQDYEALQTYLELTIAEINLSQSWTEIRIPMRPNGQVGWVPSAALQTTNVSHTEIVVNRETERLSVYVNGAFKLTVPVGIGHWTNPTRPTPAGHFWITESFPSTDSFYGPWVFGTSDYAYDTGFPDGSIVGIHGTNAPSLIPGDPSHGCIRLRNANLLKVMRYVSIGAALLVK